MTIGHFLNDCGYIARSPNGNRVRLGAGLFLGVSALRMKARHFHGNRFLYSEIFARQNYFFQSGKDDPLIFDCGANIGFATIYFKWLYPKARIVCFEPDPQTVNLLRNNVGLNGFQNVVIEECALWDSDGEIKFFVDDRPGSTIMSADPRRSFKTSINVRAKRLSSFISEPVDFLKLDIEGAEENVLHDLQVSGTIHKIKQMVIEYHHNIPGHPAKLGDFLQQLQISGFKYQVHSSIYPVTKQDVYQDILINAYR